MAYEYPFPLSTSNSKLCVTHPFAAKQTYFLSLQL